MKHKIVTMALTMFLLVTMGVRAETKPPTKNGESTSESTQRVDIKTLSGLIYTKCKITRIEPDGITVFHSKGVAKIPFTILSAEYQKRYSYDPTNAMAYAQASAEQNVANCDRMKQVRVEAYQMEMDRRKKAQADLDLWQAQEEAKNRRSATPRRVSLAGPVSVSSIPKVRRIEKSVIGFEPSPPPSSSSSSSSSLSSSSSSSRTTPRPSSVNSTPPTSLGHKNPWGEAKTSVIGRFPTYAAAHQRMQAMKTTYVGGTLEALDEMMINSGDSSMSVQRPPEHRIEPSPDSNSWLLIETRF